MNSLPGLEVWRNGLIQAGRAVFAVYRQIKEAGLDYRAMSLVYTSLLALIPLLAVTFSVLKAFGADAYLEPFLLEMLNPLGGNTSEISGHILDSVKRLNVGLLGSVGLLSLLYTSASLLEKIEESFNHIWRKKAKSARSLLRRFSDYLSFILAGPLLVFTAFGGMSEIFHRAAGFAWAEGSLSLVFSASQVVMPYVFIILAFTFLYQFIPDAPVNFRSALFGGAVAGLLWKLAGWVFASFMAGSAQYHAVYSTFAILILFMVWLYLSWLIMLLGVQVTFFHQFPRYLYLHFSQTRLSARMIERLGLLMMVLVGKRFLHGEPPWHLLELSERLQLPDDCVDEVLQILAEAGFIMPAGEEGAGFAPARDIASIKVLDVLTAIRSAHEADFTWNPDGLAEPTVDGLTKRLDVAERAEVGGITLRELVFEGVV
jgi:membrane protein